MQRIIMITLILMPISANISNAQSAGTRPRYVPDSTPAATSISGPIDSVLSTGSSSIAWGTSQSAQAVLIVPSAEMSGDRTGELAEDLNVMCAIFDKLLGAAGVKTRSWHSPSHHNRSSRCVYLPNFGPLFLIEVDFPLAAPPETTSREGDAQSQDALWTEVRNTMRSPRTRTSYRHDRMLTEYDSLKVESLKRTLRRALKHVSNVRHLSGAEQIVAVVIESPNVRDVVGHITGTNGAYRTITSGNSRPPNVISVRSSKKEVDALAEGRIDGAAFDASVTILCYQLPLLRSDDEASQTRRY